MNLQLLRNKTLPANEVVVVCKGLKARHMVPKEHAIDGKEGSTVDLMPGRDVHIESCKDLLNHGRDFNQMIAYWMMEGYLGHVDSVEEAYQKGHKIYMDIKYDKKQETEALQEKAFKDWTSLSTYRRYREPFATTMLAFDHVFGREMPDLGDLVPDNGVIKTFVKPNEQKKCSTLLLDGNHLGRQVQEFFSTDQLEHFAYFNPRPSLFRFKRATPSLSVLILRGCSLLGEIDESIGTMKNLKVLEISDSRSIKELPGSLFTRLSKLQTLNLSCLGIESLPAKSFVKLVELRRLILRGCFRLKELPSIKGMTNLEVVDLYGAKSFAKLSTTKLGNHNIQILDLSHTRINRVPNLITQTGSPHLTHLFLRNCSELHVLDIVEKIKSLKVLDLSGAVGLRQMSYLGSDDLQVLDLSRTDLHSLPDSFFEKLSKLQDLSLSETDTSSIPSLSRLSKLRRLIVKNCPLQSLPTLKELSSLEVLDVSGCDKLQVLEGLSDCANLLVLNLSGCNALKEMEENVFGNLKFLRSLNLSQTNTKIFKNEYLRDLGSLQVLDLSETSIKDLPSMCNLKSLKQLLLAGNGELTAVPDLDALSELEVMDLSGTSVSNGILDKAPSSLQRLLLKDCSEIKGSLMLSSLTRLIELDLQGTGAEEFPYEDLEKMAQLRFLRLPEKIDVARVDLNRINLPEELVWQINRLPKEEHQVDVFKSSAILIGSDNTKSLLVVAEDESKSAEVKEPSTSSDGNRQSTSADAGEGVVHSTSADVGEGIKQSTSADGSSGSKQSMSAVAGDESKQSMSADTGEGVIQSTSADVGEGIKQSLSADGSSGSKQPMSADAGDISKLSTSAGAKDGNEESTPTGASGENKQSTSAGDGNKQPKTAAVTEGSEQSMSADPTDRNEQSMSADAKDQKEKSTSAGGKDKSTESMSAEDAHSFRLVEGQWEAYLKQFHFSVSPPNVYFGGNELVFKGRNFANIKSQGCSVEIHGFSNVPESAKGALKQAVNIAFIGNNSIESLSGLSFHDFAGMKVCWIRRCEGMKFVLQERDRSFQFPGRLETLVLSNLVNLESFCDGNAPPQSIESLKHVYVDCCPVLRKIVSASHPLICLETLQIQFCDILQAVSDETLPNLRKLKLLGLPKLQQIGCDLPSLQSLIIRECPELCDLGKFVASSRQLNRLCLDSCPNLRFVFSSSMTPENLEELEIRSCDGLTALFEDPGSLPKLQRLRLWNLPNMEKVEGDFPSLQTCQIEFCPRLPRILWPQMKNRSNPDN